MQNKKNTIEDKNFILEVCQKLLNAKFIREVETCKYSIKCLVDFDEDGNEDIVIRNHILRKFEKLGYRVDILGSLWLEIFFEDVETMIDDCFKVGD